jgi:adenine-specific DNA methylase
MLNTGFNKMINNEHKFPKTRYQGSKYKLIPWIKESIKDLEFKSVLDAFSGTGSVSYLFKEMNKQVFTNDIMSCNYWIGKALIENNSIYLDDETLNLILTKDTNFIYDNFIERTFTDIYYTHAENIWLDIVVQNIGRVTDEYKKAIAYWALMQSCIIKRPYNLFHRKNLHIRTADVKRSFGNKTTWDKPFEHFFRLFTKEANNAIFDNKKINVVSCNNIVNIEHINNIDLVYMDPPYIPKKGSITTYNDFYHFLNGLVDYQNWNKKIDYNSKHLKLKSAYSVWEDKKEILNEFKRLFKKFENSIIVVSYRSDGIPSIEDLTNILESMNKQVEIKTINYKYALANTESQEILIIAK